MATDPDLILVITFEIIVDASQNIRKNVQSVVAYRWIRIGSVSQNLKGLGSASDPDLFLLDSDRFRIFLYVDPATSAASTRATPNG